jgi:hypothetical protein
LIPWSWQMEGIRLKVAEMGIVGTLEAHRGRGLMRMLNEEFDKTLDEDCFDLAVIQGIPGFYQQFGYYYAVPLENHVNLPLHVLSDQQEQSAYGFRLAGPGDVPFLTAQDERYRRSVSLSAFRDEAHWRYLLTESQETEYGSEFWIVEEDGQERFYCRIPQEGFGTGLIVSEVSETITIEALQALFAFFRAKALERDKPYIRLNLHNESPAARSAVALGAKLGTPYAWQIKIPDPVRLITTMIPVLERRVQASTFYHFSGCFRLNLFRSSVDLNWSRGRLESVSAGSGECDLSLSVPAELLPALSLGHRSWQELRHIRPDLSPNSDMSALLVDTLFPPSRLWIHEQY